MSMTNTDIINALSTKIVETNLETKTNTRLEKSTEVLTKFDNIYKPLVTFLQDLKTLDKELNSPINNNE